MNFANICSVDQKELKMNRIITARVQLPVDSHRIRDAIELDSTGSRPFPVLRMKM